MNKRDAVKKIAQNHDYLVVHEAAQEALRDGSDAALTRALIVARESGRYGVTVDTANEALGFKKR